MNPMSYEALKDNAKFKAFCARRINGKVINTSPQFIHGFQPWFVAANSLILLEVRLTLLVFCLCAAESPTVNRGS